jgi:hypothetical protein
MGIPRVRRLPNDLLFANSWKNLNLHMMTQKVKYRMYFIKSVARGQCSSFNYYFNLAGANWIL